MAGALLKVLLLLKNNLLTDDTCTADNQTAVVNQLIHVGIGEYSLNACLRRIGRCVTIVTPSLSRGQSCP